MSDSVNRKIDKVEAAVHGSDFESYLKSFKLDCQVRNLTDKSIECYVERLGYLHSFRVPTPPCCRAFPVTRARW